MLSQKDKAIQWGIKDEFTVKRFKSKLLYKENGCIEFDGPFWDKRKMYRGFTVCKTLKEHGKSQHLLVKAHRFAFALYYGFDALPKAGDPFTAKTKVVNHICHNKSCVNPKHLNILTSSENLQKENQKLNV